MRYLIGPNAGGPIAPWSLIRETLVQIRCHLNSFKAYFTGNWMSYVPSQSDSYVAQNSGFQVPYPEKWGMPDARTQITFFWVHLGSSFFNMS